jgi:hypothetical protein
MVESLRLATEKRNDKITSLVSRIRDFKDLAAKLNLTRKSTVNQASQDFLTNLLFFFKIGLLDRLSLTRFT